MAICELCSCYSQLVLTLLCVVKSNPFQLAYMRKRENTIMCVCMCVWYNFNRLQFRLWAITRESVQAHKTSNQTMLTMNDSSGINAEKKNRIDLMNAINHGAWLGNRFWLTRFYTNFLLFVKMDQNELLTWSSEQFYLFAMSNDIRTDPLSLRMYFVSSLFVSVVSFFLLFILHHIYLQAEIIRSF